MQVLILNGSPRPKGHTKLEGMGVFSTNGYDPAVPEEKLEELRRFGASFRGRIIQVVC